MTIVPFGERLIVKRLAELESRAGLVLPDSTKSRSVVGQVVHKGPDAATVEVGDIIFFGKYSGHEFPKDDRYIDSKKYEECLIMNAADVLGRLEVEKLEVIPA